MTTLAANISTYGESADFSDSGTFENFGGGTDDFENTYSYDTLGDMTGITQTGQTAPVDGSANGVTDKNVAMSYDADQRLVGVDMYQSSGTSDLVSSAAYGYDADSDLTGLTYYSDTGHTGTPLAGYHWDYNSAGVVTDEYSRNDSSDGSSAADSYGTSSDWGKTAYTYDPTAQLTAATYTSFSTAQTAPANYSADYDPNGNRTSATGGDGTSTTAESEASSTNRLLFDGTYYYAYDAEGNRVAQYKITSGTDTSLGTQASPNSEASDITVYTWNNANEMTSATHYNTAADWSAGTYSYVGEYAVNYAYDALGEMVTRNATLGEFYPIGGGGDDDYTEDLTLGTTTENFIYDGQNIVLVMASNGQVIDRNLTGPAADQVFATEEVVAVLSGPQAAGTVNWLLTDNQGTVRDVVQYGSGVVDHLVYGAFGQLVSQSASSAGDQPIFFYDGTWQDPITGLNKMAARWYDALDAVFDSYDPDSFGGGQTNLMEYCGNSPTNATDPSGTSSLWGNGYDSNGNFIGFGSPEIEPVNAANENRSLIGASGQVGWEKQQFQPSFNDPLSRGAFTYSQSRSKGTAFCGRPTWVSAYSLATLLASPTCILPQRAAIRSRWRSTR